VATLELVEKVSTRPAAAYTVMIAHAPP
jgi:hypothetical protein